MGGRGEGGQGQHQQEEEATDIKILGLGKEYWGAGSRSETLTPPASYEEISLVEKESGSGRSAEKEEWQMRVRAEERATSKPPGCHIAEHPSC
ncbi:hypothetical protein NDU88_005397 [Pleurodeles waltl]|uniref:Uncharacterized protein n=1 Tax=Pleurodeles waltl TaxID=8319 RepID=A0AAV7PFM1_PLEWA|nr:hypothetical protein NDU88_005397 [Pleurodeles waltl]